MYRINGHSSHWNSQPLINATPAGNLILSAATLFSGNTFASINSFGSFCNIPLISKTTFFDIQKQYLWPAVNNAWKNTYQKQVISELKHSDPIDLCGDGRADSPGHNAKYGTTLMEESTSKIIDFQLVQVTEVTSSNAMEAEGCKRSLNFRIDQEVPTRCLSTDRHPTVSSNMK